jgi:hypothetical protein
MTGPRPAGYAWTADDDQKLMAMIEAKTSVAVIAHKLKRTVGAVQSRRAKLRRLTNTTSSKPSSRATSASIDRCQAPRRREIGGRAPAGPRSALAGGRTTDRDEATAAISPGSCVMPSQPVPELTGNRSIKLNQ